MYLWALQVTKAANRWLHLIGNILLPIITLFLFNSDLRSR